MSRTILITGAAVGIGAETARLLAPGSRLVLHYNASQAAAEALQAELAPKCEQVLCVGADLTTDDGCIQLRRAVAKTFGSLDALVNNAGGMVERQSVRGLAWRHLQDTFALNVFSTMRLTGLFADLLDLGERPCIVNVTSIAMRHGAPSATAYGAAKSAIDAFTRGAAAELAPRIRVNAVAPGIIDTRFHARVTAPEKLQRFKESTPLGRLGAPAEVASVIKFLIESEFMTGETIDCNGGLFMR